MNIEQLVSEYIGIRTDLDIKRKLYQEFEDVAKSAMTKIEMEILELSESTGVESFKTSKGTAFRTKKTFAGLAAVNGRQLLEDYVMESGDFSVFTNHISKAHIEELIEEGVDLDSIGVNYTQTYAIQFRKS